MADKRVDVGVRLKLEQTDAAANEIEKLRKRVLQLEAETTHAEAGFADLAKQAAAMTLAVNVMPAIHQMVDFAKSLVGAAVGGDAADTALAGLITTVQGIPWEQAKAQAGGFGDDLDAIAISAGVVGDDVGGALQAMVELKGATDVGVAGAVRSVEQLSTVAGVLGKSVEGIGREFGFMQEGVVKTKGQMFQLLQTTGIFGNDTKKAAEYWSKLTEESRIKALDYGLSKISESMGKAEPSAKQLLTSVDNLFDVAKEKLGESLMQELVPVLTDVKNRMSAAIPAIERVAHEIGPVVAHWIGAATEKIESGFKYLETHAQEIHDAITSAFETARNVVDYIVANKDAIALAFGAKAAIPAIGGAVSGVKAAASGASSVAGVLGIAGTVGTAAVMASFVAAVAAFAAAAYFMGKHVQESKEHVENQVTTLEAIHKVAESGDVERVEKLAAHFKSLAVITDGELNPSLQAALEHIHGIAEASQRMKDTDFSRVEQQIATAGDAMRGIADASQQVAKTIDVGEYHTLFTGTAQQLAANQTTILIDAYNEASRTGNTALMAMAAKTVAGSELLKDAFLKSSMEIEGGLEKFSDVLLGQGSQFSGFTSAIRRKAGSTLPTAPVVHMSGGQSFKITQDFRDVDPDKIALIFEQDMVKLAENRIQARTTIPFGG